jgi:hypothetical protein
MRTYSSLMTGWLVATILCGATPGRTSDSSSLDKHAQAVDGVTANTGSEKVASRLASQLNEAWGRTPAPYTAESLTAQRTQTGWGWGGVLIGNRLAQQMAETRLAANPALTPEQALVESLAAVTAARQAHTGWGVIAKDNGVKLGPLVSSVKKSTESVTASLQSSGKQGSGKPGTKSADGTAAKAERSAKSDKARADSASFSNSFDTGPAAAGHGSLGRGHDKENSPGASAEAGHGGGGGQGGGNGGGQGGGNGGGSGGGGGGGKGK